MRSRPFSLESLVNEGRPTISQTRPWHEPYCFYGTVWNQPRWRSLERLVASGDLDCVGAAVLAFLARAGVALVIVSPRARAGKSTLMRTLLDYVPHEAEVIFLRGVHEPFTFLGETGEQASHCRVLVANEISPHLPVYVWGEAARRAIELGSRPGYVLWGTAHARDRADLLTQWRESPLRARIPEETTYPVVVALDFRQGNSRHPWWSCVTIEVGSLRLDASGCVAPGIDTHYDTFSRIDAVCHAVCEQVELPLSSVRQSLRQLVCIFDEAARRSADS